MAPPMDRNYLTYRVRKRWPGCGSEEWVGTVSDWDDEAQKWIVLWTDPRNPSTDYETYHTPTQLATMDKHFPDVVQSPTVRAKLKRRSVPRE
mmetsp:Transcript_38333/g.122935  ORF Transcript_38333/g.122935 Transcript_38333/m.122935 type:complete len:92 (-) Transcript_38333:576-851(-)